MRNVYRVLVGKSGWKRPIRKSRLDDNIKMYLSKIVWKEVDWLHLAQDRDQ
jgi:hypothetical protein